MSPRSDTSPSSNGSIRTGQPSAVHTQTSSTATSRCQRQLLMPEKDLARHTSERGGLAVPLVTGQHGCQFSALSHHAGALDWAEAQVMAARDDPAARVALISRTYDGP